MHIVRTWDAKVSIAIVGLAASLMFATTDASAQERALGVDISYWNNGTSSTGTPQSSWDLGFSSDPGGGNRKFAFIRATRGGTTGVDQPQGTPGGGTLSTLSRRYDDPRFVQNINRATTAGMLAGPYHYARLDIVANWPSAGQIANNGTDEANHFIEMAGAWMRPGYLMPMFDLEEGQNEITPQNPNGTPGRSPNEGAQFVLDFSNRIYDVMGIRPAMYINGSYSSWLQGASSSLRNQIAQPVANGPSVVGPAYPMLWTARYAYQGDEGNPGIQTANPKDTASTFYGPWDDYGVTHPWDFWQYSSTSSIPGFNSVDSGIDTNVSHGDIEYVRNFLVPAVWRNNSSGDWSTLANWNSGQTPIAPIQSPGQTTPFATGPLPTARLPGAAGSGPTSGQYDTVILERPDANITVTISAGTNINIRKMYMRETLDITGGSLTINYNPTYRPDNSTNVLHAGPISAQFSGPVTLSGTGSLSVHTLQIDAAKTLTLAGGTLAFNKINLISNSATKINVTGDVNINPLNNATATITRTGSTGSVDLTGGTRQFTVGNGSADVDLSVAVPITNGGLTKAGAGTMKLDGANTFAGNVTIHGGTLRYGDASGLSSSSLVTVNDTARLEMNGVSDTIAGLASDAGHTTGVVQQGAANLTVAASSGDNTYSGTITGSGTFTKDGAATQRLNGINTLGAVVINSGSLLFLKNNTTGNVTVNGGTLGGTGSVSGAVTVNSGAHLSPGASVESLGVGSLTLNAGSVLDIEIETIGVNDLINVAGLLTLNGGSINVSMAEGGEFFPGVYPIIDYETLNGSLASLGTPIGPEGFDYELVTTGSRLDLVVSVAGIPGDFNDDGAVDAMDYIIWKKLRDTEADLPNDGDLPGPIGSAHYALWQQNFGRSEGDGGQGGSEVPEPAAAVLIVLGMVGFAAIRRDR